MDCGETSSVLELPRDAPSRRSVVGLLAGSLWAEESGRAVGLSRPTDCPPRCSQQRHSQGERRGRFRDVAGAAAKWTARYSWRCSSPERSAPPRGGRIGLGSFKNFGWGDHGQHRSCSRHHRRPGRRAPTRAGTASGPSSAPSCDPPLSSNHQRFAPVGEDRAAHPETGSGETRAPEATGVAVVPARRARTRRPTGPSRLIRSFGCRP